MAITHCALSFDLETVNFDSFTIALTGNGKGAIGGAVISDGMKKEEIKPSKRICFPGLKMVNSICAPYGCRIWR